MPSGPKCFPTRHRVRRGTRSRWIWKAARWSNAILLPSLSEKKMPNYLPFDPNPRRPKILPPPKTCDSQFHVLGPASRYPIRPGAAYEMPTATWEAALRVHKALGIERGIVVQTTTYGCLL